MRLGMTTKMTLQVRPDRICAGWEARTTAAQETGGTTALIPQRIQIIRRGPGERGAAPRLHRGQSLVEVGNQVFLILDTNGKANAALVDAHPVAPLLADRAMRGCGRMRGQRFYAAQ